MYDKEIRISFPEYGIAIPALESRKIRTMESLLAHPLLESRLAEWLVEDVPVEIGQHDLVRVHHTDYVADLYGEQLERRLIEAYELVDSEGKYNRYDPGSATRSLIEMRADILKIVAGTYCAIQVALDKDFCYFLGGGMHHAHPDFGHGFCLVNDIAVAVARARHEGLARRVWIIDTDAHRGDGTAEIFAGNPEVKTLSIHMARGWPLDGDEYLPDGSLNPAWIPGDVDIPIGIGEEETYIPRLMEGLLELEKNGLPDFALVVAGADPFEKDELPSTAPLALTKKQLFSRDREVYRYLEERGINSAWLAAGGYGSSSWEIHAGFLEWVLLRRFRQRVVL